MTGINLSVQIVRKVWAFNDWPVAYTFMGEERLRIWEAHSLDRQTDAVPGTVLEAREGIEVRIPATGDDILALDSVQLPGKKRIPVHEFINAHDLRGFCFNSKEKA